MTRSPFLFLTLPLLVCLLPDPVATQDSRFDSEILELAGAPAVAEAFSVIETLEPATTQALIDLVQIPAPPFREEARAAAFADLLRGAGADSVVDGSAAALPA